MIKFIKRRLGMLKQEEDNKYLMSILKSLYKTSVPALSLIIKNLSYLDKGTYRNIRNFKNAIRLVERNLDKSKGGN